jgi:pimeloyl-ACP methyl ester carboxylesterase
MIKRVFCTIVMLVLMTSALRAQDISGDWQGTLGSGKDSLRLILHVDKAEAGGWKAKFFSIDQGADGMPVTTITQVGAVVAFAMPELKLTYKGTVAADGASIVGELAQGKTRPVTLVRPTAATAWPRDIHCACTTSFIPVGQGVKLEVLDWGGTGRPLILLAGLGDTAHVFDTFAQKLMAKYHVYGITRRGFGESSTPPLTESNYSADRLGDDVLAVIDARHPEKVAGLVYLEAAYEYAFYDPAHGDVNIDAAAMRKKLEDFLVTGGTDKQAVSELLHELPQMEKELQAQQTVLAGLPADPPEPEGDFGPAKAMMLGLEKYTKIPCPILAIFADPHNLGKMHEFIPAGRAMAKYMDDHTKNAISTVEADAPAAQVVRIPNASHYVFQSNEAQVLKEMDAFLGTLPN